MVVSVARLEREGGRTSTDSGSDSDENEDQSRLSIIEVPQSKGILPNEREDGEKGVEESVDDGEVEGDESQDGFLDEHDEWSEECSSHDALETVR